MKTNEKKLSLIGYGLKPSLVMSLNESQINFMSLFLIVKIRLVINLRVFIVFKNLINMNILNL